MNARVLIVIAALILGPGASAQEPALSELRQAAAAAFFGSPAYDETARLSLAEQLPEESVRGECAGAALVRKSALQLFQSAGFEEAGARLRFYEFSLHLVRSRAQKKWIDIVVFYFKIQKAGVECRYTVGQLARTEDRRQTVADGPERDRLYRDVKDISGRLTAKLRAGNVR